MRVSSLTLFFIFLFCQLFSQEVEFIAEKDNPYFGAIKISGLAKEQLADIKEDNLISVYLVEIIELSNTDVPPMMGKYIFEKNSIYFKPRFSFSQNKEYVVVFNFEKRIIKLITIPEIVKHPPVYVTNVFPSSDIWPANQLKIYIHFSAPMGLGNIYEHIKLYNESGEEVMRPFLEMEQPLWDKTQQRLTLWFDPGRIKQHLSPNENMGPPLEENKKYRLVVSKKCNDAFGNELENDFEKRFTTFKKDRQKPSPKNWEIIFPKEKKILTIIFPEMMDRATLESGIGIVDEKGNVIDGEIKISGLEQIWVFTPKNKWIPGKYKIMISEKIEDLAGNNLKRLFDEKYYAGKINTEEGVLEIPFSVPTRTPSP